MDKKHLLCVIPARSGSKRVPGKNIKDFHGIPIIAWSILASKKSDIFDEIIVSTDDPQIAQIASDYGARVPFLRPSHLSDDHTPTVDVIDHAIKTYSTLAKVPTCVCCIYPTAPFLQSSDLVKAYSLYSSTSQDRLVFSSTEYKYPVQRAFTTDDSGHTKMLFPDLFLKRSQDCDSVFHDAGQFYFAPPHVWVPNTNLLDGAVPFHIPHWRVIDIDTLDDWLYAELCFSAIMSKLVRKATS